MIRKRGEWIYFWWTYVAVCGACALMLYAFAAFAIGGNERPIQIGFALSVAKFGCLLLAAVRSSSEHPRYRLLSIIASSLLPCAYFGQMIFEKSSPFGYTWGFADALLAILVAIDIVEIVIISCGPLRLRHHRQTPDYTR